MKVKAVRFQGMEMCLEPLARGKAQIGVYKLKNIEGALVPLLVGEKLKFDLYNDAERLLLTSIQALENRGIEYEVIGFD